MGGGGGEGCCKLPWRNAWEATTRLAEVGSLEAGGCLKGQREP